MQSAVLESILQRVSKPAKYLGNEVNSIHKDFDAAKVRVALIFPDDYEIGMSHVGLKILYDILNKLPDVVCERAFAPALDMEALLREEKVSLFSLESRRPLADFDLLGFSLTYELTYVNLLNILDLSGIPVWQKDRRESDPIILAGGGCMMNAEPMADFLDAAALGDGEELILDVVNKIREYKIRRGGHGGPPGQTQGSAPTRSDLLNDLSAIEGIYIPSFFEPEYNPDGTLHQVRPLKTGYERVRKRTLQNLDTAAYPTDFVVPTVKVVHDRIGIEIQRGCNRACRFCQAGYIDRPVRQRSPETVLKIAEESIQKTGIDEISLLSLSAADYGCIVPLTKELNTRYAKRNVSLSVPATRTEMLTPALLEQIKKVRKTGFTIAPEAGSPRMRRVINKGNKVEDLYQAVTNAFSAGWDLLKMYYMVGLPFETDDDVLGIANEGNACIEICKKYSKRSELNLSISSFVPKPHTPFQWDPQMTIEETRRKYTLVRRALKDRRIHLKHHHPEMSYIEGILSRGDRRVSKLIYEAFEAGCRFDEWEEHFSFEKWQQAIAAWGLDPAFYLHRRREREEILPWDHLHAQMDKDFLWDELEKAHKEAFTEDCSQHKCSDCGVCDFRMIKNRLYVPGDQPLMAKKGHREWYGWQSAASPTSQTSPTGPTSPTPAAESPASYRIRYSKTGSARFLGHLELMGVLRRAFIRAQLPVRYSQGFHPHMKISMSHPLPSGVESTWEYLDLELSRPIDPETLRQQVNAGLPLGIVFETAESIDRGMPSLYSRATYFDYQASFHDKREWPAEVQSQISEFKKAPQWIWEREGKSAQDLKEWVEVEPSSTALKFRIRIAPEGSVRPADVIKSLTGVSDVSQVRLEKTGIGWKETTDLQLNS